MSPGCAHLLPCFISSPALGCRSSEPYFTTPTTLISPAICLASLVDLPAAGVVTSAVTALADHPARQGAQDTLQAYKQRCQGVILWQEQQPSSRQWQQQQ
jgi:hypothetical protein